MRRGVTDLGPINTHVLACRCFASAAFTITASDRPPKTRDIVHVGMNDGTSEAHREVRGALPVYWGKYFRYMHSLSIYTTAKSNIYLWHVFRLWRHSAT